MEAATPTTVVVEDSTRRERTKERLYVTFQVGGWGFLLLFQVWASLYFGDRETYDNPAETVANQVIIATLGLLISHAIRPLIHRQNWEQLNWRPLVPRVLGLAVVMSIVWCAIGYALIYGVLRETWTMTRFSTSVLFFVSCLQGSFLYTGWLALYFFYHLFDRFNRLEIERLQLLTHVKEAELRALKSQVNPHFIFNSLNSLRALIEENPAQARTAVTQLANLLRYSLQSGQMETVPFEDELRIVNDYLSLEQVRHEERLRVRLDVSPDSLGLPIPPMLLQTLVENAVKYGISVRPEGGEIAIIARRDHDSLRLQVTNPGRMANDAQQRKVSTGVGLRNAAARLRLLFGERASLQVSEAGDELVVAEAVVPLSVLHA